MNKKFCVYVYTNLINNKKYIGYTGEIKTRKSRHERCISNNLNECPKFYRSVKKYGWENFKFEILEWFSTAEEASNAEIEYIKKYDSVKNGLNILNGGKKFATGENSHMYGKKNTHSYETLLKIVQIRNFTPVETIKKIKEMINDGYSSKDILKINNISSKVLLNIKHNDTWKWVDPQIITVPKHKQLTDLETKEIIRLWNNFYGLLPDFHKKISVKYKISLNGVTRLLFKGKFSHLITHKALSVAEAAILKSDKMVKESKLKFTVEQMSEIKKMINNNVKSKIIRGKFNISKSLLIMVKANKVWKNIEPKVFYNAKKLKPKNVTNKFTEEQIIHLINLWNNYNGTVKNFVKSISPEFNLNYDRCCYIIRYGKFKHLVTKSSKRNRK